MRAVIAVLLIPLLGCGAVFVGTNTNFGNSAISGTVSFVQLTTVSGPNGTSVNVTFVTLLTNGFSNSFTFCGSHSSLFPMNQFMNVSFTPAQPCISTFVVTVH